jgi:bla regulator protein blaR1
MPILCSYHRFALMVPLAALAGVTALTSPTFAADSVSSASASAFVLFSPGSRGADMSGSMEDVRRATSLRTDTQGLLYVRQGSSAYVIRDPATIRKAESFFEPEEALGARQTELGSQQTELGRQQSRLGAQQAALSNRQANGSPREGEDLARREEELSRQQEALGKQQEALGRKQEELGRQQDRVARIASEQVQSLIGDALRSGLAQRVQ